MPQADSAPQPGPLAGQHEGPTDDQIVCNVVWTGEVFDFLGAFVASQIAASGLRYRFIANACPPAQLVAMRGFADAHPGRVVEVVEVSRDRMVRHGDALDEMFHTRDDGPYFALIDPDILALGPFMDTFLRVLATTDAVTSGKEVWSEDNVRPEDHAGVSGEHFFDRDGYVFGSPHLAIYRHDALADTLDRWGVGFASAGSDISAAARARLVEVGRSYWIYDTGKIVNILFQADGHTIRHEENPNLLHIGGVSHFLAPPSSAPAARDLPPAWGEGPDWGEDPRHARRYAAASYAAGVLRALRDSAAVPEVPAGADPAMAERLRNTRDELVRHLAATPHEAAR